LANLAAANVMHRKTRTAVAVLSVGLGVAAVMLLVGLADGTLNAIAHRLESVGADVLFQPPDASLILGVTSAVMPLELVPLIQRTPGVTGVTPVLNWQVSQITGSPESLNLWAVEPGSFDAISGGLDLVSGRGLSGINDLVVDEVLAARHGLRLGEQLRLLDCQFRVVGVSRSGAGGRLFARIEDIGEAIGSPRKASFFLIKGRASREAAGLAQALQERFKGYKITPIAQVSRAIQDNAVGLKQFKHALTSVAVVMTFLVVLLAMYTGVLERTREIGVLRAIGATQAFVMRVVLAESGIICVAGVALGICLAMLGRVGLESVFPAEDVLFTPQWAAIAGALGIAGGLLGSLYPAIKAARMDPIRALSFE
jgi:putative ABC transport system permease protein